MLTVYDVMPREFVEALADPLTTDLSIRDNGHGFITRMGAHIDIGPQADKVPAMLCLIADAAGTVINDENPIIKVSLKDRHGRLGMQRWLGKRPEIGGAWTATARIPIGKRLSFQEQIQYGTLKENEARWIENSINNGDSGIVIGEMGSGKSTMLNTMLGASALSNKITVKLERSEELIGPYICTTYIIGEHCSFEVAREKALSENAKVFIVGEATSGEDMREVLNTMGTGHQSFTTLHAKDIDDAPFRIEDMLRQTSDTRTQEQMHGNIVRNIDFCILMKEAEHGKKIVADIASFEMHNGIAVRKPVLNNEEYDG